MEDRIMDMDTKRVTVEGLRGADVATIRVLTQDVLGLPVNQIHPITVCDLFALAEVSDQVPEQLAQDLSAFVGRCGRELSDLPDGAALDDYTQGLLTMDASIVPETFRGVLAGLSEEGDDGVKTILKGLASHFGDAVPQPFEVSEATSTASVAAEKKAPAKKTKSKAAAKKQNDAERREWIAEFAMSRLTNYETGLKESLLVGAARHKAPWDDLTEREVRSVLRAMGREGKIRTTVGRWLVSR
jgi:hypothetical protein